MKSSATVAALAVLALAGLFTYYFILPRVPFIAYPEPGDFTPPDNQFVAVTSYGETDKKSGGERTTIAETFICEFDECILTGKVEYAVKPNRNSGHVNIPKFVSCDSECTWTWDETEGLGRTDSPKLYIAGPKKIKKGECAKLCAGTRWYIETNAMWIEWKSADFLSKCPVDPVTLKHIEPNETKLFSGQVNLCSGLHCSKCPDNLGFEYCKVKCVNPENEIIYDGIIKNGDSKIRKKKNGDFVDLLYCLSNYAGNTYEIYGWDCPEPPSPPVQLCGNGILDENEECDWGKGFKDNPDCAETGETETCNGKKYGTRPAHGDCDNECKCHFPDFTFTCEKDKCGAECSSGEWQWCETSDGYKGKQYCDDSTCEWGVCSRTGECKLEPEPEKGCSGNWALVCVYDDEIGAKWKKTEYCRFGCVNGECLPGCGDGELNEGEECEPPNQNNNYYCEQDTEVCEGKKVAIRDSKGYCDSQCFCVEDDLIFRCKKGFCNAECSDGEVDYTCTVNGIPGKRECLDTCVWSTCQQIGECVPGSSESCGRCGIRYCDSNGFWGSCQGEGVCYPGETKTCTSPQGCIHTLICTENCEWPSCPIDECIPGSEESCSVGGIPGQRICGSNCKWSQCQQTGECVPGSTENCGDCGIKTCNENGIWGPCEPYPNMCGAEYECVER